MGDEIGGHHVSGHVHTTATIDQIETTEDNRRFTFKVGTEQGSVRAYIPDCGFSFSRTSDVIDRASSDV